MDVVSGHRNGATEPGESNYNPEEDLGTESAELVQEIGHCITRLFRMTSLVRQAAPTDLFAKALSRNRYHFDEQYDVAHVGEKFPKLATAEKEWLRKRLGQAITQRRRYLSYILDHRDKLERMLHDDEENLKHEAGGTRHVQRLPLHKNVQLDTSSRPSTFFTKATTAVLDQVTPTMFAIDNDSDPEDDAKSYTTISRSVDGDLDTSATMKIPKLEDLRTGTKKEVECPFCFRIKRFRNERIWRKHVFSDLRTYVCTFPECGSSYFGDINDWFRHEMDNHRVSYECQLCQKKCYETEEQYLAHIRRHHPALLYDGEKQAICDMARKPLQQLKPQNCPCCTDWTDRLRERTSVDSSGRGALSDSIYVAPTLFKRHLASHQEQLALFAVPIPNASAEEGVRSMAANDMSKSAISDRSAHSPLLLGSPTSSIAGDEALQQEGRSKHDLAAEELRKETEQKQEEGLQGRMERLKGHSPSSLSSDNSPGFGSAGMIDFDEKHDNFEESVEVGTSMESTHSLSTTPLIDKFDPTPYPVFLQPRTAAKLDEKWNDLEWAQMTRIREGMSTNDNTKESSPWARCSGDEYASRDRYVNVGPYQANRVRLRVPEGANDYINASPITLIATRPGTRLRYIATQGPKADSWPHFWRMLWYETHSPAMVVMITKTHEQGREKCFPYFPLSLAAPTLQINEYDEFGDGLVHDLRLKKLHQHDELRFVTRQLALSGASKDDFKPEVKCKPFYVWHVLFERWPDFSIPEGHEKTAFLNLIRFSRINDDSASPRIVHDSAGVGRTGTFIALDWLMYELEEGALDDVPDDQDPIVQVITRLRDQRPMMVQSKQQFVFIYDVLRELWRERWIKLHPSEASKLSIAANEPGKPNMKKKKRDPFDQTKGAFGE